MSQVLLKNHLNIEAVEQIAHYCALSDKNFQKQSFIAHCTNGLEALELKQRVQHIIHCLHDYLPADFAQCARVLEQMPEVWSNSDDRHSNFVAWPIIDYVAVYGIDAPEIAVPLLKKLTPLFSAEFAIQPFILQHFELTYRHLLQFAEDDNEHVRRLACEGMRPRLPWGIRLTRFCQDPRPALAILDKLKQDPSLYVRKSVANHINDISKDNAPIALSLCQTWQASANKNTQWIIEHGLRGLLKQGHREALAILGYRQNAAIELTQFSLENHTISLGDDLQFAFTVQHQNAKAQSLMIDFIIHFMKKNGQHQAKVFKLKKLKLNANEPKRISKAFSFKPINTRTYYAGEHWLEIMINGQLLAKQRFTVKA